MSEDYGQRLRAARKAAGLTLRELGERCAVDFTSLSHLEHGRFIPSFALGRRLTDALGVDLLPPSELARAHARIAELEAGNRAMCDALAPFAYAAIHKQGTEFTFGSCVWALCALRDHAIEPPPTGEGEQAWIDWRDRQRHPETEPQRQRQRSLEERAKRGGRDGMVALVQLINQDEE